MNEFKPTFSFKQFAVSDRRCGMKVGTDGVLLGAWASLPQGLSRARVLDVGTGCGLIALMMAQRFHDAAITAVELDCDAAEDADINISLSPWADRIDLQCCDFRDVEGGFDLIVSNPPFFVNGEAAPEASRAMARHADSLSPLSLIEWGAEHLNDNGKLALIAPVELSGDIEAQAAISRLFIHRRADVATSRRRGITRTLWELSATPAYGNGSICPVIEVNSPEYAELTKDFYLHF